MKVTYRLVAVSRQNKLELIDVPEEKFKVTMQAVMSIDGSTTCTGIAILEKRSGSLLATLAVERTDGESQVRYKVEYKKLLTRLLRENEIHSIFYEEPFIQYAEAAKALFLIRSSVEELVIENEPEFNHIEYVEVNNKRWKKLLLGEGKCPTGRELEKAAVKAEVTRQLPFMSRVTQDEIDATGLGFVAVTQLKKGEEKELASKKKPKPFKYNIEFIGADNDDEFYTEFFDVLHELKIPAAVQDNGSSIVSIPGTGIFENHLYKAMGDEDKILVIKFKSKHHSNVVLEYRIVDLTVNNEYIYAIVWRKSRI